MDREEMMGAVEAEQKSCNGWMRVGVRQREEEKFSLCRGLSLGICVRDPSSEVAGWPGTQCWQQCSWSSSFKCSCWFWDKVHANVTVYAVKATKVHFHRLHSVNCISIRLRISLQSAVCCIYLPFICFLFCDEALNDPLFIIYHSPLKQYKP